MHASMLTCICRGQHAALFGICTETVNLYTGVHMCTWRLYMHTLPVRVSGGRGGGGEGQVILKRTDNPRKECP